MKMVSIEHVETNGKYVDEKVILRFEGVKVTIVRNTGNWHPEGEPWTASIRADITRYENPDNWAYGLAGHGTSMEGAFYNAYKFAKSKTLKFPKSWLFEVHSAIENLQV